MNLIKKEKQIAKIKKELTEVDILLQLAEEASELSQAASKRARIIIGNNPTPKTVDQNLNDLIGEFADVSLCKDVLFGKSKDANINIVKTSKLDRWVSRLDNKRNDSGKNSIYYDCAKSPFVIDSKGSRVYEGDIVRGESDGKSWKIIGIYRDNRPWVLNAVPVVKYPEDVEFNDIKQLKPQWVLLKDAKRDDMSNGYHFDIGDVVYKYNSPTPIKIIDYYRESISGIYHAKCKSKFQEDLIDIPFNNLSNSNPDTFDALQADERFSDKDYCMKVLLMDDMSIVNSSDNDLSTLRLYSVRDRVKNLSK